MATLLAALKTSNEALYSFAQAIERLDAGCASDGMPLVPGEAPMIGGPDGVYLTVEAFRRASTVCGETNIILMRLEP